jgi:hypothetical protein
VPERTADYRKLQHTAELLRTARHRWIPEPQFLELSAAFDAANPNWITNAGGLMGAAVCDECCGLEAAVPSLMSWMGDASRFPQLWCQTANETLARARSIAASAS